MKQENAPKVELLAPAGNPECLKAALYFGADAVYFAGKSHGLRAFAANFDRDEMKSAIDLCHEAGKRAYVTVNAILKPDEFDGLDEYLADVYSMGADALIVSDPGVLARIRALGDYEVHLSTQCSTSNPESAAFWYRNGIKRIVLARELTLEEIGQICRNTPKELELEVFVHGAMCVAYSGRCLLSSAFTGRSGNKGACAQPCRWEYTISEPGYPGEYFPISEDEHGTYILNSKDLMMIDHIPELIRTGVRSLKIEGRMKSVYYVASVVSAYRKAIDAYYADPEGYSPDPALVRELESSATRRFTTGFFFGPPDHDGQDTKKDYNTRGLAFAAVVKRVGSDGRCIVEQRGKFDVGDALVPLSPKLPPEPFTVTSIVNMEGEAQNSAPHPQQLVYINCPKGLVPGDILRRMG